MEYKITTLVDLKMESLRYAHYRQLAIETENYTNAMYYQLLYLDAITQYLDIKDKMTQKEINTFLSAMMCLDYRGL